MGARTRGRTREGAAHTQAYACPSAPPSPSPPVRAQVGADVRAWFAATPRQPRMLPQKRPASALGLPLAAPARPMPPAQRASAQQPMQHPGDARRAQPGAAGAQHPRQAPRAQGRAGAAQQRTGAGSVGGGLAGVATIDQFYLSRHCAVCDALTRAQQPLCDACAARPQPAMAVLQVRRPAGLWVSTAPWRTRAHAAARSTVLSALAAVYQPCVVCGRAARRCRAACPRVHLQHALHSTALH